MSLAFAATSLHGKKKKFWLKSISKQCCNGGGSAINRSKMRSHQNLLSVLPLRVTAKGQVAKRTMEDLQLLLT